MPRLTFILATLVAIPLYAQDPVKPIESGVADFGFAQPPAGPEHAVLKQLAGEWDTHVKHYGQGGDAHESAGTESARMIGEYWLLTQIEGSFDGQSFSGRGLIGFDPEKQKYIGLWMDSMTPSISTSEGTYDKKTKTFTWAGDMPSPDGDKVRFRNVGVLKDANTKLESMYVPTPDGKEALAMEITYTRRKTAAVAVDPKHAAVKAATPEIEKIQNSVGTWNASVAMSMPGAPPMTSSGKQVDVLTCGGRWIETSFTGEFGGIPFVGHGFSGFDPDENKYVSFWIDSMTPVLGISKGNFDKAGNLTLTTKRPGMDGNPVETTETTVWKGNDSRTLEMVSVGKDGSDAGTMKIDYMRAKK
jgi:hypothetical protein